MKIAIYGGTFDPIHNTHLQIIAYLSGQFDKVIVVPNNQSPFKSANTASEHRLCMLRLALQDYDKVEIDLQELNRKPPSFTIDTVKNLIVKYSNAQLFLCLGQDSVKQFDRWSQYNELMSMCKIVVIKRTPYFSMDNFDSFDINMIQLQETPFDSFVMDKNFDGLSSSIVRVAYSLGWGKCFVPKSVNEYITQCGLYQDFCKISSRLCDFDLSENRISHIKRSVLNGVSLACVYHVEVDKVVVAMLLHDIVKNTSLQKLQAMGMDTIGFEKLPDKIVHSWAGECVAKKIFGICDTDILHAIRYHTTGRPGMSILEKIVYLADATEWGRLQDYGQSLEQKNALLNIIYAAFLGEIDRAMHLALKFSMDSLHHRGLEVYYLTQQALDFYNK
ncbi:MAG: nicotinate (nicotinamide) nucleotide adenylyltransferase [Clostridiales bacterium]|nr:nicotinate (nicotinamide) nucleotide adenylyltransferase [Clostridiales bacterium]